MVNYLAVHHLGEKMLPGSTACWHDAKAWININAWKDYCRLHWTMLFPEAHKYSLERIPPGETGSPNSTYCRTTRDHSNSWKVQQTQEESENLEAAKLRAAAARSGNKGSQMENIAAAWEDTEEGSWIRTRWGVLKAQMHKLLLILTLKSHLLSKVMIEPSSYSK